MPKRAILFAFAMLLAAGAAEAQYGGGMGGGSGGGHRGGGRHKQQPPDPPPASSAEAPRPSGREAAPDKAQITGVITAIDPASGRVTISYDQVDALNWPRGTTPFAVEKPALLAGLSVGEKVRFHVESQQISAIAPIGPSASPGTR
jgi:Cu/Ag efflux protein CusF